MITVFNEKGGVGKTNIAYSIAKDLDRPYITNDSSIVSSVYDKARFIDNKMPIEKGTVYDLGGFITKYVADVLTASDLVIVPTICDYNAMLKAIKVIEFAGVEKCLIIANMIDRPQEHKEIVSVITEEYPTAKIMPLKRSKAFRNGLEEGLSMRELSDSSRLNKHIYKSILAQYENILKEITV